MDQHIKENSAGAVVVDFENLKIVIYSRRQPVQWCLPKGKLKPGENAEQAAKREVREETAVNAKPIAYLGQIAYQYEKSSSVTVDKTVSFFLMEKIDISGNIYDPEVIDVEWADFETALNKLSFQLERDIVLNARRFIEKEHNKV